MVTPQNKAWEGQGALALRPRAGPPYMLLYKNFQAQPPPYHTEQADISPQRYHKLHGRAAGGTKALTTPGWGTQGTS